MPRLASHIYMNQYNIKFQKCTLLRWMVQKMMVMMHLQDLFDYGKRYGTDFFGGV